MKVLICGSTLGNGVSSKSGSPRPYQIQSLDYLVPARDYIQGDHNIQKCGSELKSLQIEHNQALYNKIKSFLSDQMVFEADLTLSPDPENPSRNVVTDIKAS